MLIRIVKLSFKPEKINLFLSNFEQQKTAIRNFNGCHLLELYQDKNQKNIFFTYSYWTDEKALNSYRNSKLFQNIWKNTKIHFNDKPLAWSVNKLESLS